MTVSAGCWDIDKFGTVHSTRRWRRLTSALAYCTTLRRSPEWLDQKHAIRSRRRWSKLHPGVDADTHEIVAVEFTPDDVGDISELPDLLDQLDADVASMTADGAYHGQVAYDAVAERHPQAAVIVPPRITAVADGTTSTQRGQHLTSIVGDGRMSLQRSSGYNRRSLVETTMFGYKSVIGRLVRGIAHAQNLARDYAEGTMPRICGRCGNAGSAANASGTSMTRASCMRVPERMPKGTKGTT